MSAFYEVRTRAKTAVGYVVSPPNSWGRVRGTIDLSLNVTPRAVTHYVKKFPQVDTASRRFFGLEYRLKRERHPFVVDAEDFPEIREVRVTEKHSLMADAIEHLDDISQSRHFRLAQHAIASHGRAEFRHLIVRTEEEALSVIHGYVSGLVSSFAEHGHRDDLPQNPGLAAIGPDGQLLKSGQGHHRFATARELGSPRIRLAVHFVAQKWATDHGFDAARGRFSSWERLRSGLFDVEKRHQID